MSIGNTSSFRYYTRNGQPFIEETITDSDDNVISITNPYDSSIDVLLVDEDEYNSTLTAYLQSISDAQAAFGNSMSTEAQSRETLKLSAIAKLVGLGLTQNEAQITVRGYVEQEGEDS